MFTEPQHVRKFMTNSFLVMNTQQTNTIVVGCAIDAGLTLAGSVEGVEIVWIKKDYKSRPKLLRIPPSLVQPGQQQLVVKVRIFLR